MVRLSGGVDADSVGVATGVAGRLVDHDLVLAVQEMGGHETGDAGADDRDPHPSTSTTRVRLRLVLRVPV